MNRPKNSYTTDSLRSDKLHSQFGFTPSNNSKRVFVIRESNAYCCQNSKLAASHLDADQRMVYSHSSVYIRVHYTAYTPVSNAKILYLLLNRHQPVSYIACPVNSDARVLNFAPSLRYVYTKNGKSATPELCENFHARIITPKKPL